MNKSKAYYLDETEQLPHLTAQETESLALAYMSGDLSAMEKMVEGNMYLVTDVLSDLDLSEDMYMDAAQEGNMALFQMLSELEDTEDMVPRLKAGIYRRIEEFCEEEASSVKPAEELAAHLNVLDRICEELAARDGKEPDVSEVAALMKMDEDEVRYLMQIALSAIKKD